MIRLLTIAVLTTLSPCGSWAGAFEDGQRFMEQRRYPEAVAAFEREAKTNPGSPEVLLNLGWAYWHARRISSAWKVGDTLVKLDSGNPVFLVFLANTQIERKNYSEAADLARKALKLSPDDKDASMVLAVALFRLQRPQESMELLEKVSARHPEYKKVVYRKAVFLAEMGKKEEALKYLDRLLAAEPGNSAYHRSRAKILFDLNRTTEAKNEWTDLVRKDKDPEALLNLGYTYWRERNYDEAMRIGTLLLKIDDGNPVFLRFMANLEIEKMNYRAALALSEKALRLAPNDRDASVMLSKALFRLQREREAMAILGRLVKEHPDNVSVVFHWAEILDRMGHLEEALPFYEKLLKGDADNPLYVLNRANVLYRLGRFDEAIAGWKKLAAAEPPSLSALRQLREDSVSRQSWDEAVKWQKRIIDLNPQEHTGWDKLSIVYMQMKDYKNSYLAAKQAIEVDPVSINGYYLKAEALDRMQDWSQARKAYEDIMERNPNSLRALDGLSYALEAQQRYGDAIREIRRMKKLTEPTVSPYHSVHEARLLADSGRFNAARTIVRDLTTRKPIRIPALLYHGIGKFDRSDSISRAEFRAHMEELKKRGYQTITVSELSQAFQGKFKLPPKPLLLTFDDGRVDSFQNADPVLEALGWKATMFVHLSIHRKPGFHANPEDIARWQATGRWDMQAHGFQAHDPMPLDAAGRTGHFLPNRMWLAQEKRLETPIEFRNRIDNEYRKARQGVEEIVPGRPVVAFAYPYGDYGQNDYTNTPQAVFMNRETVAKHFKLAFIQEQYGINSLASNPRDLRRFEVPKGMEPKELAEHIEVSDPWLQAKLLEAELWVRSGQVGQAHAEFAALEQHGFNQPRVLADKGLAYEKAGNYYEAQKLFVKAYNEHPRKDLFGNEPFRRLLNQSERNTAPRVGAEVQGFSDSHSNSYAKSLLRSRMMVKGVRLEAFGGQGRYYDRDAAEAGLPRITGKEGGLGLSAFLTPRLQIEGGAGRRYFYEGASGHADNYSANLAFQAFRRLAFKVRDGMGNIDTAAAIRQGRRYRADGGGIVFDPELNWRATADYDVTRFNDGNVEKDAKLALMRRLSEQWSVGGAYLNGDSKSAAAEYYTPQRLQQYTGVVEWSQGLGKRSEATGLRRGEVTALYQGGYGFQRSASQAVHVLGASITWRVADFVSFMVDGQYSQSPTYIGRRAQAGLGVSF
ncbi:MAG: tetratricopeptide repeat protein [Elusimicrobia bacterium]|nr:tetratricopeptide repeat protein [Elusimicrobiota bacterium]